MDEMGTPVEGTPSALEKEYVWEGESPSVAVLPATSGK